MYTTHRVVHFRVYNIFIDFNVHIYTLNYTYKRSFGCSSVCSLNGYRNDDGLLL